MEKKKLIIFDVDGTIWDSEKDVFLSFNHTLKENAHMEIDKEEFQKLAGLHLGEMFRRALPESKKELASEYEKKYRRRLVLSIEKRNETTQSDCLAYILI